MQQSWLLHISIYFDSPERADVNVNGLDAGDQVPDMWKAVMEKAREPHLPLECTRVYL